MGYETTIAKTTPLPKIKKKKNYRLFLFYSTIFFFLENLPSKILLLYDTVI